MNKPIFKDLIILLLLILIILFACLFLPIKIPIHFNMKGEADTIVNKYFLILFVIIPYLAYWKFLRKKK
ncbi:DUF1648 domain-containing protein [Enterococcus sp. AZ196]|uniref:DUF1648 domain-containing protein n=1 Tax=Enterococcus sp. AZ196 TaxID=2774659 RepID=UPI003D266401